MRESANDSESNKPPTKRSAPRKATAKKVTPEVPRGVNYAPEGKQSLREFADLKKPNTKMERALLAVQYLSEVLERKVNAGEVVAVFRYLEWENPTNPLNNLQKCQTRSWVDVKDQDNITVLFAGDEYLRTKLPKPAPPK